MPGVADHLTRTSQGDPGWLALAPVRGVRYSPEAVGDLGMVTSPPYDLIDEEGVRRLMAAAPYNVVRLILPQRNARGGAERYERAAETLRRWLAEGVLAADPAPALYVYEQRSAQSVQRGLLGGVGLIPPEAGIVLPHEDVLPGPVADRLALMRATAANLEPIFLMYEGGGPASELVDDVADTRAPDRQVTTDDGVVHRLWPVTEGEWHGEVARDLRGRRALIADGHHRYATYLRLQAEHRAAGRGPGPWDYGLALLVDSTRYPPRLGAIHRVIPGLDPAEAADRARRACRVTRVSDHLAEAMDALADAARTGPAFLLAGDGGHELVADPDPIALAQAMPPDRSARWRRLATAVLHAWLLPKIWGVEDPEAVRIVHHDPAEAVRTASRHRGTAVLLAPLAVGEVFALAAEGERVPHKSTSFGPKPRTGLVLRTFAEDSRP
ncbi:MAG: DUF1015 family protein [Streptosporangiales bacterium]|nr:DUF1015 family protein [Streptosporangiales bacterium]